MTLNPDPHSSAHHSDTTAGDTFGGLGTPDAPAEELMPRWLLRLRNCTGHEDPILSQDGPTPRTP